MSDGTVKLKDLNDFLKPSDVCILPLGGGMQSAPKPGSFASPMYSKEGDRKAALDSSVQVARVTLSDCITCSGCVTSAETVLLDSETALRSFREGLSSETLLPAVCLSQQAVASLARKYGLSLQSTYRRLATFFRERGAARVFDISFARRIALLELAEEVIARLEAGGSLMASACPGFVCYMEKKYGSDVLQLLSRVKSPQAIIGSVIKQLLPRLPNAPDITGKRMWVGCVMPCHDKKLEAARGELTHEGSPEVDAVLTADELAGWIAEVAGSLTAVAESGLDEDFGGDHGPLGSLCEGSLVGSGGFLEFAVREVSRRIPGLPEAPMTIPFETVGRGSDFKRYTVHRDGGAPLHFAACYGFRNVQKVLKQVTSGKCQYHFAEVMSCPGGCTNGSGQAGEDTHDKVQLAEVEEIYKQAETTADLWDCGAVKCVYKILGGEPGSSPAHALFHTSFENRSDTGMAALEW